jgi:hypothetical protein
MTARFRRVPGLTARPFVSTWPQLDGQSANEDGDKPGGSEDFSRAKR